MVALVALVLALFPVRQTMLAEWTMRVSDEAGAPLSNIAVEQSWTNYSFGMDAWSERVTDSNGLAVFPAVVRWRPAGYWLLRALPIVLNVHGSFGSKDGRVRVFDRAVEFAPGVGSSASCGDARCVAAPLRSDLRVFLTSRAEPSTRAHFAANQAALEAFAEEWARDGEARFLGRYEPTQYRWDGWQLDERRGSFHVMSADYRTWTVASLDEAFRVAQLDPAYARRWFARADQLQIYAVRKLDDRAGVEIRFFPGAHGLRYAPRGDDDALAALMSADRWKLDAVMKPLAGRWFYFASEAPGQQGRRQ